MCTPAMQAKLRENREKEDKRFGEALAAKRAKAEEPTTATEAVPPAAATSTGSDAMAIDDEDEAAMLQAALAISMGSEPETTGKSGGVAAPSGDVFGNKLPDEFTGLYEISGVVTHKGRSADSGHYVGWVRQEPGSDAWWCYNDDKVTAVTTAEIMRLRGGGDLDMAYLVFYRFKDPR